MMMMMMIAHRSCVSKCNLSAQSDVKYCPRLCILPYLLPLFRYEHSKDTEHECPKTPEHVKSASSQ
jgi:hypothetical protein